jgi:hypothetical protein
LLVDFVARGLAAGALIGPLVCGLAGDRIGFMTAEFVRAAERSRSDDTHRLWAEIGAEAM